MTSKTTNDLTGQHIKGYDLQEKVGAGGFGAVYRARQALVKREVAVKVILPQYANNPDFVRRFEAEAQLVANLEHLHIVPLYDYWRDSSGAYLVMRWYRGGSLLDVLNNGHWPIKDVPRIVDQICAALAVAHRNDVVHRDLKPANILLDEERNCYLADFGIAKDHGHISEHADAIEAEEAATEGFIGSPEYISPEQIREEEVTPRSDIYNMGLMLYELVSGKKPFEGAPLSTLISKHLMIPLPEVTKVKPDLPETINDVIARATEKDPADRYENIMDLALEFRTALLDTGTQEIERLAHRTQPAFELDKLGITPVRVEVEPDNPYKGLRAFSEADANDFFGREGLVQSLLERFEDEDLQARFLALVGPSGSGKSSVVRAGMLPKMRHGALPNSANWFYVEMSPGVHPMEELEAALLRIAINPPASLLGQLNEDVRGLTRAIKRVLPADESTELVIFIDQFEEVFTMVESEKERTHFLNSLVEVTKDASTRLRLIVTLRADFFDRPLLYPDFGQLVSDCNVAVLPLNSEQLHAAIVRPAENAGLILDRELVGQIISEVGEQPGALPLLQYALSELFVRRDGRRLTMDAYTSIGGVTGALARRAEDIYDQLSEAQGSAAQQMFLRLVTLGEGQEDTRRRATLDELYSLEGDDDLMQYVIDFFGKYRLLTFDNDPKTRIPTVEVAHEALIRQWRSLREWLDNSRDELRTQRRVAQAAIEWRAANQDTSYLAHGAQLEQYEEWLKTTQLALSDAEREYVQESLIERERLRRIDEDRRAREARIERRSRRILIALVAVLAIATFGALGLSGYAVGQQQTALTAEAAALANANIAATNVVDAANSADAAATAAALAQRNEDEARSLAFISSSQLALNNDETDLAILLAQQANTEGASTVQTRRVLSEAAYAPGTRRLFTQPEDRVEAIAYLPDGLRALSAGRDAIMLLYELETGTVVRRFEGHDDWIYDIAVHPEGTRALTASTDTTLIEWDIATGEILQRLEGHTGFVRAVNYLPDGTGAVSVSEDGEFIVWDLTTGEIRAQNEEPVAQTIRALAVSPSGFTALTGQADGSILWWNVGSAVPLRPAFNAAENGGHAQEVWGLVYKPDETGFISASQDATLLSWSFESAQPTTEFLGHTGRVTSVDISADGSRIVSGSEDNTVLLWDAETGALMQRFIGHSFLVYDVAFSPDGNRLLSGSWDESVREWDINYGAQLAQVGTGAGEHSDDIRSVDFATGAGRAASGSIDGSVIIWDTASFAVLHKLEGHAGGVNVVAFDDAGERLISGADDNTLIMWDVATGQEIRRFEGHSDAIWAAAFNRAGDTIATGSRDNTAILWDANTGEQLNRLFGHTFRITDVEFNPDGGLLATSSYDRRVLVWRVETGEVIRELEGHEDWVLTVAFSADGDWLLSGSADNSLILWETRSGEQIRRYEGHTALVNEVAFSPDGQTLVSSGDDGVILLWNIATGEILQRFTGHTDAVNEVAFNADGTVVLSGSDDNTVRAWAVRLSVDELNAWLAQNRQLRDFTCAERERFNIEPLCARPTPQVSDSA